LIDKAEEHISPHQLYLNSRAKLPLTRKMFSIIKHHGFKQPLDFSSTVASLTGSHATLFDIITRLLQAAVLGEG
jgi:hypothetical protein